MHCLTCLPLCIIILSFFTVEGEELSKTMTELGFPRLHRHKLACLRQELIETFVE